MNRDDIIYELINRGYKAQPQDVVKNGILKEGIVLRSTNNIAPTVYVDDFINQGLSVAEAVDACIHIYDNNRSIDFDTSCLTRQTFLLNNVYLGLQKTSDEDIIHYKTEYEGIEAYVYIRVSIGDGKGIIKMTSALRKASGLSQEALMKAAEHNTFNETKFVNFTNMLSIPEEMTGFTCITNKDQTKGASAILNKEALKSYGEKYGTHRIIAIPSSVHEWILISFPRF